MKLLLLSFLLCPAISLASVTVNTPSNGEVVSSPFALSASAQVCGAEAVSAMGYSLDSSPDTTIVAANSVDAKVAASMGAHILHVKSWTHTNHNCTMDVSITVAPETPYPADAQTVSNIQLLNWSTEHDAGTTGASTGATGLVTSPSVQGSSRKYQTTSTGYGGQRYWVSFGDDTEATHFVYDAWVYMAAPAANIANVEMDMNQTMANGQTVIYGFQCDGWSGTWDYTANAGTPAKPVDVWLHSKAACNPRAWTPNEWHHVAISYSRDDLGNVTYTSVTFDGVLSPIGATVPSAFALGWAPVLLTNLQIDGLGTGTTSTVYLDNVTVVRW